MHRRALLTDRPPPPKKRLVAVSGKGGTGKTAFTAMMTRALLESGRAGRLLLIDADPALGLPGAVGVRVKRTMGQVREEIIKTARSGSQEEKAHERPSPARCSAPWSWARSRSWRQGPRSRRVSCCPVSPGARQC